MLYFGHLTIDQVIFHLVQPLPEANFSPLYSYFATSLLPAILLTWLAFRLLYLPPRRQLAVDSPAPSSTFAVDDRAKSLVAVSPAEMELSRSISQINRLLIAKEPLRSNYPIRHFLLKHQFLLAGVLLLSSILAICYTFSLPQYLHGTWNQSPLMSEKFVDTTKVQLEFPAKRRNLIYIFLESVESSFTEAQYGGLGKHNYIPHLTELALTEGNIHFSNADKLGGARQVAPLGWTVAGMVAQSGGIPLKTPFNPNDYGKDTDFLPGLFNLGDCLAREGYNLELILGSNSRFGNRQKLYSEHGQYRILDFLAMKREHFVDSGYDNGFWGVEDEKLFDIAKQRLTELAKRNQPFAVSMLTVDTHFPNGYLYDDFPQPFDNSYANALYCSDQRVYDFVHWIEEQDFFPDTTIVLSGDHLTMANLFVKSNLDQEGERTVYNCIINPDPKLKNIPQSRLHNRIFTTMDFFPTTLAALGVNIEGDKLAYGTNLFSDHPTLPEELGFEHFRELMEGYSSFYNKKFFNNH